VTLRPRVFPAVPAPVGRDAAEGLERADITVSGLDHGGLSYELRVFLGNPSADADTPLDGGAGYAGSIHVYGQGRPPPTAGEDGDARRPPRSILATDAVRAASAKANAGEVSVTLVPVAVGGQEADVDLDAAPVSVRID
jgi:hypothetical protein